MTLAGVVLAGCTTAAGTRDDRPPDGPVEVAVGPAGNLIFEPDSLAVPPGTTVRWLWESDNHNVVVERRPDGAGWGGHESVEDTGFTHEHTFEVEGTYDYYCRPHRDAGMTAEITVAEGATATPPPTGRQGTGSAETESTPGSEDAFTDARERDEVTVAVGPAGALVFDPEKLRISTGTTVRWVWESDVHDIVVGEQPAAADWRGHGTIEDGGYTYAHTFSTEGRYEYYCRPHRSVGMTGVLLVE